MSDMFESTEGGLPKEELAKIWAEVTEGTREPFMVTFDQRGHSFSEKDEIDARSERFTIMSMARHGNLSIKEIQEHPLSCHADWVFSCSSCGAWASIYLDLDAKTARAETECTLPQGITTVTRLEVPSGHMVVCDSLRDVYEIEDERERDFADYNSKLGQSQYVEAMAELGCAYGPVGNSSPTIYLKDDGTYVIASQRDEGDYDEDEEVPEPFMPLGEAKAWICTDLWAYSIADRDDYLSKGGKLDDKRFKTTFEVEPGTYEFTLHTGRRDFDQWAEPAIYAEFRKI